MSGPPARRATDPPRRISAALVLTLALLLGSGCSPEAPTPQRADPGDVEDTAHEIVAAVAEGRADRVMEHVALGFRSDDDLGFVDVQAIVESFLLRPAPPGVRLNHLRVEPAADPPGARRVEAWVDFTPHGALEPDAPLPPGGASYSFDLVFVERDGLWKALRGSYRRR